MQTTQLIFQGQWTHKSQGTVLQLTTDHQMICAQVHTHHKSYVRIIHQVHVICTSKGMQKSLGCALYVRCALSVGKYSNFSHLLCPAYLPLLLYHIQDVLGSNLKPRDFHTDVFHSFHQFLQENHGIFNIKLYHSLFHILSTSIQCSIV